MSLLTSLQMYYKFNGNYNNEIAGTNVATPSNSLLGACFGKIQQGTFYNGTNAQINYTSIAALNSATACTVNCWVKFTGQLPTEGCILEARGSGIAKFAFYSKGTELYWDLCPPGGNPNTDFGITSGLGLAVNTWYMLTAVFDGSLTGNANRAKVYVNNVQKTLTFTGTIQNALTGSATPYTTGHSFAGFWVQCMQAELGLWSRALSATEISTLYNSGAGLTYPFNGYLFPNTACYNFCQWVLNYHYTRFTTARINAITAISNAAAANTSVSQHDWNQFIEITQRVYLPYLQNTQQQGSLG